MEPVEILKIIKRKLFEPHKKIIYNTEGKKLVVDSDEQRKTDDDDLDVYDGWNVADKDYVNLKINELTSKLFKDTFGKAIIPSAPPLEEHSVPKKFKTMIYLKGTKDNRNKKYMFDTLLLKEGSVINEKHICIQKHLTIKDPVVLNSLKRNEDNKKITDLKNNFVQMTYMKKGDKTNILSCMDEEYIKENCSIGFDIDFKTEEELGDIGMQLYITTH